MQLCLARPRSFSPRPKEETHLPPGGSVQADHRAGEGAADSKDTFYPNSLNQPSPRGDREPGGTEGHFLGLLVWDSPRIIL
jgi:hypothetical protein